MLDIQIPWQLPALYWIVGVGLGYGIHAIVNRMQFVAASNSAKAIIERAKREQEALIREGQIQAKDEVLKAKEQFEKDTWTRRQELIAIEDRVNQRETALDRKATALDNKELSIDGRLEDIGREKQNLIQQQDELKAAATKYREELAHVSKMPVDEAKRILMQSLDAELHNEAGALVRRFHDEAVRRAEQEARKIITMAIERYSAPQVNEITTSTVTLPNDEMKGRIIGREGRNIRSLESITGVQFLIDDTPGVVVISGFDPLRREVARLSIERLITDGRVHPARIEEVVHKVQAELDETVRKAGEEAIATLGLQSVNPDVVKLLGRLKYRHSYGQNVLKHSIEMATIMGTMASELGLDVMLARRVGLLHDIGKAMDQDAQAQGGHAVAAAEFLKRHGEIPVVVNAVGAHHNEMPAESHYAILCKAADAVTAARPGARSETTEFYLKRLENLELIANSYRGVQRSYAIEAGREIRVVVEPGQIDDNEAMQMARNISKQIEQELDYPGQIRVTVIRETRCVEYAR
ncbi:MAG TPA: ribonuclease Y [Kiritimatiellia bacterium]|jgi:ribonuclease Y